LHQTESGVLSDEQKENLISRLTEVSSEIMNAPQEFFSITIKELSFPDYGYWLYCIGWDYEYKMVALI